MGWPFCPHCGTILDPPEIDEVKCSYCPFRSNFQDILVGQVTTKSSSRQPQPWAIDESNNIQNESDKHMIIEEPCPKCGNPEQYFYTVQLRSVDEGSTVFYECTKCGNKCSRNN
jgi:DNA-directed RNA polymerase I subunit RPA12